MSAQEPDAKPERVDPPVGIDELRTDIAETRRRLGDTVEALAAKVNLPRRLRNKAAKVSARAGRVVEGTASQTKAALIRLLRIGRS
ncbi:MAG: DUF3618 domain-containing protein [Sporichthyaceae bacterium]|nr:DUF3618 domain-containing protein [Sporichthyaceae bacterium]